MPTLPSGTVTFLFTDIAGSTECWEHDHQALTVAVTRHIVPLDTAIHTHGWLHDPELPAPSAGGCHRRAAWWSVTSMAGDSCSAGSANFA
jgi:class 3 adenylate cyclase